MKGAPWKYMGYLEGEGRGGEGEEGREREGGEVCAYTTREGEMRWE